MVLYSHRLRRREPWAISWGIPRASSTWLGSRLPLVQALPELAQMPAMSRRSSRLSPSMPSKQKLTMPGTLWSGSPLQREQGILLRPSMSLSRMAVTFSAFSSRCSQLSFNAAAMARMPGMASVPPRSPRSWAPPSIKFFSLIPLRQYMAPTPLGAWNLWPERESMSMLSRTTSTLTWPTAWTASVWKRMPRSRHSAPISRMGWRVPISLLAYMMVTRQVSGRMAAASSSRRIRPFSWTGR